MAKLFKKLDLPPDVKLTDVGTRSERPFQILGLLETITLGDLVANVVFLSTLANQFDHVRLHVKYRDLRPYCKEIISLSPWIDLAEPFPERWPAFFRKFGSAVKPPKAHGQMAIGAQKGKHNYIYDMIITSPMASEDAIHALRDPVPLRLPEGHAEQLRARLVAHGVKPDRWFAVFHYRESTYQYRPGSADRNSDPAAFDALVDHIIALGGQAVRLGHPGMRAFRPREGFVDLSTVADGFLLHATAVSHARFAITGPSGPLIIAMAFAVPSSMVDAVDTGGVWGGGRTDILTHEVTTPKGDILRNASLLDSGLLDIDILAARAKTEPGYRIRKATAGELAEVATRLFRRTSDCPAWRPPAIVPTGPKPNQVGWPLQLSYPMPWIDL